VSLSASLATALDRSGAFDAVLRLRSRVGSDALPVLCYHRVADAQPDSPFDADLVDTTPAQFDEQLRMLKRYYTVIGLDELLAALDNGKAPRGAALITFDDGYKDNATAALPVLKSHGVSATFFLSSDYLTQRRIYWWERASYFFAKTTLRRARLDYPTDLVLELGSNAALSKKLVLTMIKTVRGLDLERFLDGLGKSLEVEWNPELERRLADDLILSWDDVREMKRHGMHFGSHTKSHRILPTLELAELRVELAESKQHIEQELGEPVHSISYPVGMSIKAIKPITEAVKSAGYRVGFTNISGVALVDNLDPLDISRVSMDRSTSASRLRGMLAFPPLCTLTQPWTSS
jgi:peptidoglycan/xylan/chitin deacetylase (PgdA/CDA1 family)